MSKARRAVVGQRDQTGFLVALSSPVDTGTLGVVVEHGNVVGVALPIQSILARGYWERFNGTAEQEASILARVPADDKLTIAKI